MIRPCYGLLQKYLLIKYNVIPINNSTEVMSCLEQSSPDIIISDIMMRTLTVSLLLH